jgi:hypothetical protein
MSHVRTLAAIVALLMVNHTYAKPCRAPDAASVPPAPALEPEVHDKLSHTELVNINVPLREFREWFLKAPLETLLPGTQKVPSVVGTSGIGSPTFPAPGATRFVCLADGSGAVERVVSSEPGKFSYVVWGYTLPAAEALLYGHGQFEFSETGQATAVRWTYSFRLKGDRFPGFLGPIGRTLFRWSFLDSVYADFMRSGMHAIKEGAERAAARPSS